MPAPRFEPKQRDPFEVAPTNSYPPKAPIWVYCRGSWKPGVIEAASAFAATVIYRPHAGYSLAVDTVTADDLVARTDPDPLFDRLEETKVATGLNATVDQVLMFPAV